MTAMQRQRWASPVRNSQDATLILVRHGETSWNLQGRVQGHSDAPLNDLGREQAQRVARQLSTLKLRGVYASDSSRSVETAKIVAAPHQLQVMTGTALRERSYGVLEGKTLEEAGRTEGAWFLTWQADRRAAPPAGESQDDMTTRAMAAVREIARLHPGQMVAVITHGGPIKAVLYEILRIPLTLWRLTWIENGSITVLRGTPDVMRVACFNDTCHLVGVAVHANEAEDG